MPESRNFPPILDLFASDPCWMIDAAQASGLLGLQTLSLDAVCGAVGARPPSVEAVRMDSGALRVGSVAVIPVLGVLANAKDMDPREVGTSYERISAMLTDTQADPEVSARVLYIDSPGGAARPVDAVATRMRGSRGAGKPTLAFTPNLMASAALYLGAQADRVYAGPGAWVGSIGTITMAMDATGYLDKIGIKINTIKSTPTKDVGSPFRPMSEADRAVLQRDVDAYDAQFVAALAAGRGAPEARVREWQSARGYIGQQGVAAGLIDGVRSSLDEVIAEAAAMRPSRAAHSSVAAGGGQSGTQSRAAAEVITVSKEQAAAGGAGAKADSVVEVVGAVGAGGAVGAIDLDKVRAEAQAEAAKRNTDVLTIRRDFGHIEGAAELCDKALADPKVGVADLRNSIMDLVKKDRSPLGNVEVGQSGQEKLRSACELMLVSRLNGGVERSLRAGGPRAQQAAELLGFADAAQASRAFRAAEGDGLRRMSLMALAESSAARALGRGHRFTSDQEVLGAAFGHSSSDFPLLLGNSMNKALLNYFAETPTTYQEWCAIGSLRDFKSADRLTLSEPASLKLMDENGKPEEATFNERREQAQLRTFARKISFGRQMIINDDLSGISRFLQGWGMASARKPEELAYAEVTNNANQSDGVALFHATHNNLPSGAALSESSLIAAMALMMKQKGFGEDTAYLLVQPEFLLTGVALWGTAKKLVTSMGSTEDNKSGNVANVIRDMVRPIWSPYITSDTAWYVAAGPATPLVEVLFLNGKREPTITQVGNGSQLGVEYEIFFDVDAKAIHHEAGVKGN